jgi:salicylate hydroxylase
MGSTSPPLEIAILGAGIAGLTFAIALTTQQSSPSPALKISIYESRPAFSEIGAGVGFGPNAIKAMSLISPAISANYDKIKTPNSPGKEGVWYDFRWGHDMPKENGGGKGGDLIVTVDGQTGSAHCGASRSQFLDGLVSLIPEDVKTEFGKKVVDVVQVPKDEYGRKGWKVVFADGTEALADAVVGCDGIRSAARKILLGKDNEVATAVYTGKYAYRKVIPMAKAIEAVGEEVRDRQMYLGKGGHILTFPIRKGAALNIVAFRNSADKTWTDSRWVVPSSRDELLKDFEGWAEKPSKILEVSQGQPCTRADH